MDTYKSFLLLELYNLNQPSQIVAHACPPYASSHAQFSNINLAACTKLTLLLPTKENIYL